MHARVVFPTICDGFFDAAPGATRPPRPAVASAAGSGHIRGLSQPILTAATAGERQWFVNEPFADGTARPPDNAMIPVAPEFLFAEVSNPLWAVGPYWRNCTWSNRAERREL
jgi:hypothetical protein